jgi:N-carbamoylputrescine amidase
MIRVAAVNSWSEPLAIRQNLHGIAYYLKKLCDKKVDYALFPELGVSGYINNADDLQSYKEQHDRVIEQLKQLSCQYPVSFSVGLPMPLNDDDWGIGQLTLYKGQQLSQHHKTHLSVHEKKVFSAGQQLAVFEQDSIQTGIQLCLESHYPELSLAMSQQQAELLCFAFASPRETPEDKFERFKMLLQARAYDNACFVMACNQTGLTPSGKRYAGVAMVLSPRGKVLAHSLGMEANYCMADIDLSAIEAIKNSVMSNFPAYRNTNFKLSFKK